MQELGREERACLLVIRLFYCLGDLNSRKQVLSIFGDWPVILKCKGTEEAGELARSKEFLPRLEVVSANHIRGHRYGDIGSCPANVMRSEFAFQPDILQ